VPARPAGPARLSTQKKPQFQLNLAKYLLQYIIPGHTRTHILVTLKEKYKNLVKNIFFVEGWEGSCLTLLTQIGELDTLLLTIAVIQ
jgi:hypothetical protein